MAAGIIAFYVSPLRLTIALRHEFAILSYDLVNVGDSGRALVLGSYHLLLDVIAIRSDSPDPCSFIYFLLCIFRIQQEVAAFMVSRAWGFEK